MHFHVSSYYILKYTFLTRLRNIYRFPWARGMSFSNVWFQETLRTILGGEKLGRVTYKGSIFSWPALYPESQHFSLLELEKNRATLITFDFNAYTVFQRSGGVAKWWWKWDARKEQDVISCFMYLNYFCRSKSLNCYTEV